MESCSFACTWRAWTLKSEKNKKMVGSSYQPAQAATRTISSFGQGAEEFPGTLLQVLSYEPQAIQRIGGEAQTCIESEKEAPFKISHSFDSRGESHSGSSVSTKFIL